MKTRNKGFSRRKFLAGTAAAAGVELLPKPLFALTRAGASRAAEPPPQQQRRRPDFLHGVTPKVEEFPWKQVRLLPGGPFYDQQEINRKYLLTVPNDRLLHMFRLTSGLASSAEPLGGWEAPKCELRGHFAGGHFLSACAQAYATTGDEEIKKKGDDLVAQLAICQKANKTGYLSAFPMEEFDRLRERVPVWAPFYTIHKIMAGHYDMYRLAGNQQALETARQMANWVGSWTSPLSADLMSRVLETEHGGMFEVLCNLAEATKDFRYLGTARKFDQAQFFDPLAEFKDELRGIHANTNIPKVIGAARFYELTGAPRYRNISSFFWETVSQRRSYATGGNNDGEYWTTPPGNLSGTLNGYNEECCTGYNMLKLTRHLFSWTAEPAYMDYYERVLWNHRLGTQDEQGFKGYFVPLGNGYWKYYNTRWDSFWCCTGTGIEEFAKFANTIYYHDADGIYVNLYIASQVTWPEKGITLRQETKFPEEPTATFILQAEHPTEMALHLRIPAWVAKGGAVKLNGETLTAFSDPSSYLTLHRVWKNGDRVEISLPMSLRVEPLLGDDTLQAAMYGPFALAGRLGSQGLDQQALYAGYGTSPRFRPTPAAPLNVTLGDKFDWVEASAGGGPLSFHLVGQSSPTELVPFYLANGERYNVYWQLKAPEMRRFFT